MGRPLGLEPSAGVYPAEGQCWRQTETKWHVAARGRAGGGSAEAPRQGDTARRGPHSPYKSFMQTLSAPRRMK